MVKEKSQKRTQATPSKEAHEENGEQSGIWKDPRFQHLVEDPRFKNLPKSQRKVKIDKRFQSMFTDKKFNVKYTVDKYGRRVQQSTADNLRKYYELNSSASSDEEDEEDAGAKEAAEQRKEEKAIARQSDESGESSGSEGEPGENDELESDGEEVPKTLRERLLDPNIDYARGEGRLVTDSSSDDESSEDEDDIGLKIDHVWGELDNDAETTDESTRRLAVCNMDWDRIRATDLMVLFSSFLPPGGSVLSVKIYPSEFGKERLAEEERHGPPELVGLGKEEEEKESQVKSKKKDDSDSDSEEELVQEADSDAEEGDEYHMEKLRQYQLNRLRYYYAVVECDSVKTADKIYAECDGIEYESSATKVDLRFIPDDTSFDEDEPRDVCTELPDSNAYKPRQFTTTALQQAKVDLTWDETALERRELGDKLLTGKLEDVSDADLRKIVAYSSEEEADDDEEEEGEPEKEEEKKEEPQEVEKEEVKTEKKPKKKKDDGIAKYKALLAEINDQEKKEKEKKYEMEYSWDVDADKDGDDDDKDQDSDSKAKQQMTPIEKVLQKRSEKNKKRKEERKKKKKVAQGLDPDDPSDSDADSVPDDIDMNDPYFAEEFANGDFVEAKSKKKEKAKKQKKHTDDMDEEEKQKEQELQLLLDDDDLEEQGKQHFSLEKILKSENESKTKKKRRKQLKKSKSSIAEERKEVEDNFQVNLADERFKAVYTSHLFNIDPTDSHFKKTKAMEKIIEEKLKRRHGADGDKAATTTPKEQPESKRPKKQLENTLLVKSLKRKIQMKQQK